MLETLSYTDLTLSNERESENGAQNNDEAQNKKGYLILFHY